MAKYLYTNHGGRHMRSYESKEELKNEIKKTFAKYISEFDNIPEELKDKRVDEVDRTPAENLAYQVGWTASAWKWQAVRVYIITVIRKELI